MRKWVFLGFLFCGVCRMVVAQAVIPDADALRHVKQDKTLDFDSIFSPGQVWMQVAGYDLKSHGYMLYTNQSPITVINRNQLNYVTPNDAIRHFDKNTFELIYGGEGPERQTMTLISYADGTLILESKFTNKGYANGKLVWRQKQKMRYAWQLQS